MNERKSFAPCARTSSCVERHDKDASKPVVAQQFNLRNYFYKLTYDSKEIAELKTKIYLPSHHSESPRNQRTLLIYLQFISCNLMTINPSIKIIQD